MATSDTTAFLSGAAIAGLTALIVARGGISAGAPSVAPQPIPSPAVNLSPIAIAPSPLPTFSDSTSQIEAQKLQLEQLKMLLEQQKIETEKLKEQIRTQQASMEVLTSQTRAVASNLQVRPQQPVQSPETSTNTLLMGAFWALGGLVLGLGGGTILLGMFILLSRQQQQRTPPAVEVMTPVNDYPAYMDPGRRYIQALPPRRMVIKRARYEDPV